MKKRYSVALAVLLVLGFFSAVYAVSSYRTSFNTTYGTSGTVLSSCSLCHPGGDTSQLNGYGQDFADAGHNFKAIEGLDSDGDGYTNIVEINARTFPGDAASFPVADTTAPTVTAFTIPATATSLAISVSSFTATDNVAVTGYLLTESSTVPLATAAGWTATAPTGYTFATAGAKTLYGWAKDAAGNVSVPVSRTTTITLPDTTAPTVTSFTIPATSTSLTVSVTTFSATDNVAVTGYLLTESSTVPLATAAGWTVTAPTGYTFATAGAKTLYGWAKDAAGNVSVPVSRTTTITLPDTTAPTVTSFTIPATSTSLTVSVTTFSATDNVAVTGYLLTESSTVPLATAAGWTATAPTGYTFATAGAKTLYGWAKDAAGNVSASVSDTVTISIADTTAPTVTAFTIPTTSSSLTVAITAFSATDDVAVTGYLVTETATAPLAADASWSPTPLASHTFATAGAKTLYGWAKDAAGNVSSSVSDTTTITVADTTAPTVTSFDIPVTSDSLTIPVTAFTATDDTAVTGYLVTEAWTRPLATDSRWSSTPQTSYTFGTPGAKTLYGWAKDGAGNVSDPLGALTVIPVRSLFAGFGGAGLWSWSGSAWTKINPAVPGTMVAAGRLLYATFGGDGLWSWDGSTWTKLNVAVPVSMAVSDTVLYASFGGAGLWSWDGSAWTKINPVVPGTMVASGRLLYATFGSDGLWSWDGTTWTKINVAVPAGMVVSDTVLYASFGGAGLWSWDGSAWTKINSAVPGTMLAAGRLLYATFGSDGLWSWDGATWTKLNVAVPTGMAASGSLLYGNFEGSGLWKWDGTTWTKINVTPAARMVASGSELYADFTGSGLYRFDGAAWSEMKRENPAIMFVVF